jgi:hypothetical protein
METSEVSIVTINEDILGLADLKLPAGMMPWKSLMVS